MPANIIDTSLFTDPIVCFSDGDLAGGPGLDDPIQGLANRTRFLNNRIAAEEALRATLRTDVDDDYNAGQWLTLGARQAWALAGSPSGWRHTSGDSFSLENLGTADTLAVQFAIPWFSTPLEIALWGIQIGAPTTRAGISAALYRPGVTGTNVSRVNFPGAGDYLSQNLSTAWSGDKGLVVVNVHGPSTVGYLQLMGVGVRFQYANRSL